MLSEGSICLPKSRNMAFHRVWDAPGLVGLMMRSSEYTWEALNLCHDIKTYMDRRGDDSNSSYPENWKKAWVAKNRPSMSEIIIKQSVPVTPPDDGSKVPPSKASREAEAESLLMQGYTPAEIEEKLKNYSTSSSSSSAS